MNNVFAYTGTETENGYVPFVSVNEVNGELVVTLRSSDNNPSSAILPGEKPLELLKCLAFHLNYLVEPA